MDVINKTFRTVTEKIFLIKSGKMYMVFTKEEWSEKCHS